MLSAGKKMRILIISQFYYPDITACAFRIRETALLLAAKGCEVHVIAAEPHKATVNSMPFDDGPIKVSRVRLIKATGKSKLNYISHYLSFMFGAMKAAARHKGKFHVVWASSPPLFTAIAGLVIARARKARFCLDIRDIWPESAVVAGQISASGMLFKSAKVVEKALYKAADLITCVAQPMAAHIKSIAAKQDPLVIYNAIPEAMVAKEPAVADVANSAFKILYIGNMGYCQNLSLVVQAAAILRECKIANIKFVLVGSGIEKPMIEKMVAHEGLDNVEVLPVVAKEEAIRLMRDSAALMLHLKDDGTMDKTIPSKVFDYMASGRPILFGLKGEARDILFETGGNLYYDPANANQLADQAIKLRDDYDTLALKALANLELVKARFLRETMTDRLYEGFCRLETCFSKADS